MNTLPSVCIIIPVRNEKKTIRLCLDAILHQEYPQYKITILIADGLSSDGTREILAEYERKYKSINVLVNPGKIVPIGMNIALRQAKEEIILRIDGHCIISPDYVHQCVKHIQDDKVDGVGGPMESVGETHLAKAIAIGMSSPFGVGNSDFRTTSGKTKLVDTIPFPAYTRTIIEKVGLYDEDLVRNQDDEYNYRIREAGGRILLAENVCSKYYSRGSLVKLWRQYYQYGYWKVRVLQKHPRQMSLRQFVPPTFVVGLLGSLALAFIPPLRSLAALVPGLYLLANLIASLVTAARKGWKFLPLLPVTFAILHLSYGLGFLVGLFKFWDRWNDKTGKVPQFTNEPTI